VLERRVADTNTGSLPITTSGRAPDALTIHLVEVRPEPVGWSIPGGDELTFFLSRRSAEHAARTLARARACNGGSVELCISDLRGHLAGHVLFGAFDADPARRFAAATRRHGAPSSSLLPDVLHA
jgi:hypothetical protein